MVQWVMDNLGIVDWQIITNKHTSLGILPVRICKGCIIFLNHNENMIRNTLRHFLKSMDMHQSQLKAREKTQTHTKEKRVVSML